MILYKAADVALSASDDGIVEAIVAAYTKDRVGDRIVFGAFSDDLKEWATKGDPMPFIWSHDHGNPNSFLGQVIEAEERKDAGLWVKAQMDLDFLPAARVFELLKRRLITKFSFAYEIEDGELVSEKDADGKAVEGSEYFELRKLRTFEVGPCLVPCNDDTELLGAKRFEIMRKIGARNSSNDQSALQAAHDSLVAVGAKCAEGDEKTATENPVKIDEPPAVKIDELSQVRSLLEIENLRSLISTETRQ